MSEVLTNTSKVWNTNLFSTISDKKVDETLRRTDRTPSVGDGDGPPTTYIVKEKFEFFKPNVQVLWDEESSKSMIRELYIRGE